MHNSQPLSRLLASKCSKLLTCVCFSTIIHRIVAWLDLSHFVHPILFHLCIIYGSLEKFNKLQLLILFSLLLVLEYWIQHMGANTINTFLLFLSKLAQVQVLVPFLLLNLWMQLPLINMNDPTVSKPIQISTKKMKRKVEREVERLLRNTWAMKFPWAKAILREDGKMQHVRSKICTMVKH